MQIIKNGNNLMSKIIDSIKDGDFLKRVRGYFTYGETVIRLQMNLEYLPSLSDIAPLYTIKELDIYDIEDIKNWIDVVNNGYGEGEYGVDDAKRHFRNHLFLDISNTYFIMEKEYPIATISIGKYRNNENWGGMLA